MDYKTEAKAPSFTTNEQAQATTRIVAVALLLAGLCIAYWAWPSGITDLTLSAIAFGQLLWAISAGVVIAVSLVLFVMLWV